MLHSPLASQLSLHARYLNEAYGDDHWPWWADLQFNYAPHLLPAHPWVRGFLPYLLPPDLQPGWYADGADPNTIAEARQLSQMMGGASLEQLGL